MDQLVKSALGILRWELVEITARDGLYGLNAMHEVLRFPVFLVSLSIEAHSGREG
jgi:hypothetical protein